MSIGKARILVSVVLGVALIVAAVAFALRDDSGQSGPGSAALAGVDDDTVRIGYLLPEDLGPWGPEPGGSTADIAVGVRAVVDAVNAEQRAGGRLIEPIVLEATSRDAPQRCAELTGDGPDGVAAVVLGSRNSADALQCYADANTLVVDQSPTAHDQDRLERLAPYLWAPSLPEYGTFLRVQLEVLADDGFLDADSRVQLVATTDEVAQRAVTEVAEPFLADLGLEPVRVDQVDLERGGVNVDVDVDAVVADVKRIVEAGKASGADRVLAVGGDRLLTSLVSDFEARDFDARWAVSTFDHSAFLADNPQAVHSHLRLGMVGLGFAPLDDLGGADDGATPVPDSPTREWCVDLLDSAGVSPTRSAATWLQLLKACDSTLFLAAALDNVEPAESVTAQDFAAGVAELGDSLPSATALGSSWAPGRYAAVDTVRAMRWDPDCQCFEYFGEPIALHP